MSSLLTTYHNICAANGVKSPHLESHEVLEKMEEFKSNLCILVKRPGSICIWLALCVFMLELYRLAIEHCISLLCQVLFRTGQAQLCQDDSHISSRDVTA